MRLLIVLIIACLGVAIPGRAQTPAHDLFGQHKLPSSSNPGAFGSYAKGCLAGGAELHETTPGWQAMRLSRNRNWGHPEMIGFIERLSLRAQDAGWPRLYVGDIGQPRGGPMKSGHRSHQIGLDVDIWLRKPDAKVLSRRDRERISSHVVVARNGIDLNRHWSSSHQQVIRAAAEDPAVARIFVNAAIKRHMCHASRDANGRINAPWLRKVRPWKGHNAHFHVRLSCPKGSRGCRDQAPPPAGNGCGAELAKWFPKGQKAPDESIQKPSEEAEENLPKRTGISPGGKPLVWRAGGLAATTAAASPKRRSVLTLDDMPEICTAVLDDNSAILANLDPYIIQDIQVPSAPVFWDKSVIAHPGFIGTKYFWTPPVDLNAAEQRRISLSIEGPLPPGLVFQDRGIGNGLLTGTPEISGQWTFDLVAKNRNEDQGRLEINIKIEKLRAETAQEARPSLEHHISDFLTNFIGDECFMAIPVVVAENTINIEAFADDAAPFYDFDSAFKSAIGVEANIGGRLVTPQQCEALAFARAFPHRNPPKITLDDQDHILAPNQPLFATITGDDVRYITLLMVNPDGSVIDVSDYMTREGTDLKVAVIIPGEGPRVLVAVDTVFPLVRTDFMTPDKVDTIFENLRSGNTSRHYDMKASLAYFVLSPQ